MLKIISVYIQVKLSAKMVVFSRSSEANIQTTANFMHTKTQCTAFALACLASFDLLGPSLFFFLGSLQLKY